MTGNAQDQRSMLLQTDNEYKELATKHHQLEDRLTELSHQPYLSEPEQVEQAQIKKRKLQLKDRMEDIVRRVSGEKGAQALSA